MIGSTGLFVRAAMPLPTEYPIIIVMIGTPSDVWSLPIESKIVMHTNPTRAIRALLGLNVMAAADLLDRLH